MPAATPEAIIAVSPAALRSTLEGLGEKIREMRAVPAEQRTDNWAKDIRSTHTEILAADGELQTMEMMHRAGLLDRAGNLNMGDGPAAATAAHHGPDMRSAGARFIDDPEVAEWFTRGCRGNSPAVEIERRSLLSTVVSGDGGSLLPAGSPYLNPAGLSHRRLFIRDLVSPGQTTLNSVPYVRELNPRTNETGALSVAEGSAKPEIVIQFVHVDAPVRTIAAWVPVTRQVLEDIPTMRSYVDARLAYMVQLREELEILTGDGTGVHLTGITTATGVQTQANVTDNVTTIGLAVGLIESVDGEADGVAINPTDFWSLVTARHANQFDGEAYGRDLPFGSPPASLWGMPTVRSRSVTAGTAVVGAWRMGAQIFDRSTVTIRVSDSHASLFISNTDVILAESRLAFAIHRPDFFVKATLT